jgi:tRNA pseudouridine55 synthase
MNEGPVPPGLAASGAETPVQAGGILLLDKPVGVSSFQALRPLKRLFPKTKIGHAGTLDPAASGLLLVGIGSGTRLLEYLEGMPKTYSFTARFGLVSDSYDMEGAVEPHPGALAAGDLDADRIAGALTPFRGPIRQTPPVYSAIKIDGERACDRVRAGETVTLESREVTVHALALKAFTPSPSSAGPASSGDAGPSPSAAAGSAAPYADLEMTCSKGTYVRSLVHDLGAALGCGAVTDRIRRLAIGPFRVEAALRPADLVPGLALHPMDAAVAHLPAAVVPAAQVARFLNGQAVVPEGAVEAGTGPVPGSGSASGSASVDGNDVTAEPGAETAAAALASPSLSALEDKAPEYRALDGSGRLLAIATLSSQGLLCPRKVLARA